MHKKVSLLIVILLGVSIAVFFLLFDHTSTLSITTHTGEEAAFRLMLAQTPAEREKGLMYHTILAENSGMLFIFDEERKRDFWMKNTLIPLDIIFFDSKFQIVDIIENASPCKADPCPVYSSQKPARYVLEIKASQTKVKQIQIDDQAKWHR